MICGCSAKRVLWACCLISDSLLLSTMHSRAMLSVLSLHLKLRKCSWMHNPTPCWIPSQSTSSSSDTTSPIFPSYPNQYCSQHFLDLDSFLQPPLAANILFWSHCVSWCLHKLPCMIGAVQQEPDQWQRCLIGPEYHTSELHCCWRLPNMHST